MSDNKFIFLDIDGPLNTFGPEDFNDLLEDGYDKFNPQCVQQLERIIKATGAFIIISSTWRLRNTIQELRQIFARRNFKYVDKIIDKTIDADNFLKDYIHLPRGIEVDRWLDHNIETVVNKYSYCIIDDSSDFILHQLKHFVLIDPAKGITEKKASKAIRILNEKFITYRR